MSVREGTLEFGDIDADSRRIEPDLLVSAGQEYIVAQCAPDEIERLPETGPGPGLGLLTPEQQQQPIAALERTVRRRQIRQQRQPARLDQQALGRFAQPSKHRGTEKRELDHRNRRREGGQRRGDANTFRSVQKLTVR